MYIVAMCLVVREFACEMSNMNLCFSVPTKVVARMVNRAAQVPVTFRAVVRKLWLRLAGLHCQLRALYQSDYTPWLFENFCHFQHVNISEL